MTSILKDKYFLLSLSVAFILLFSYVSFGDEGSNGRVGIVHSVSETSNGYRFLFDDEDGSVVNCYWKSKPDEGLCVMNGSWSDDDTMFFVSSLKVLNRIQSTGYVRCSG